MDRKNLQERTKPFYVDVIKLCGGLPKNAVGFETAKQMYWLEIIKESNLVTGLKIDRLIREANELTAIFAATAKTPKTKLNQPS